jgi:hypothetical protein
MSEQMSTIQLIAYIIGMLPGAYFAVMLLIELYHHLTKKEDFLE